MKNLLSNIYIKIAIILFATMCAVICFYNIIETNHQIVNILYAIVILGIILLINKKIYMKTKKINIFIYMNLFIFLILTILSAIFFRVEYNWDVKWVMDSSREIIENGINSNIDYFKMCQNNIPILYIIVFACKITFGNEIGAYILSILCIFFSAVFSVLIAKKLKGNQFAANVSLVLLLCTPLYLNAPIVYSDSVAVLFPTVIFYIWLIFKEKINKNEKVDKNIIIYWILFSIIAYVAYLIKPTAFIAFIAIMIDLILNYKKNIKYIVIFLVIFLIFNLGYNFILTRYIMYDERENNLARPNTHYFMMGLNRPTEYGGDANGWGSYNDVDVNITGSEPTYDAKKNKNVEVIKQRLANYGVYGYLSFLKHKFVYTWAEDSTIGVMQNISWDTVYTDNIIYDIIIGDYSDKIYMPFANAFYTLLFILILISAISQFKNKNIDLINMQSACIGLAIFLLFWEACARYIYVMVPIFCILGANGIECIKQFVLTKIKNKNLLTSGTSRKEIKHNGKG